MKEFCPISGQKINDKAARLNAFFVFITSVLFILLKNTWLVWFLLIDFLIRGFISPTFSPLCAVSRNTLNLLKAKPKIVDAAPKIFAAKIGFFLSCLIILSFIMHNHIVSFALSGILIVCAFLEAFLGFCVGCRFYFIFKQISGLRK